MLSQPLNNFKPFNFLLLNDLGLPYPGVCYCTPIVTISVQNAASVHRPALSLRLPFLSQDPREKGQRAEKRQGVPSGRADAVMTRSPDICICICP